MSVNVNTRCFILSLFIRDDGERMLLGSGKYDFKDEQQHFVANSIVSDTVDVQGTDGTLLAGQVRRASTQPFDGYVGDATSTKAEVEEYRRDFIEFFAKNHFYTVVYVFSDGTAIKRQRGFVVDAPEVKELFQIQPEYHVALNFEDVNYYEYNEDEAGNEIYSQMFKIARTDSEQGGLVWDEYGAVMIDMTVAQNTVSGTSITINDALPMPPEDVKLYGDTEQVQYSGKNLFNGTYKSYVYSSSLPYQESSGITINSSDANNVNFTQNVTSYQYCLTDIITLMPNTEYTLSFNESWSGNPSAKRYWIYLYDSGTYTLVNGAAYNSVSGKNTLTFTTGATGQVAFAWGGNNTTNGITFVITNIQLELGSTATSYEPYVGGIPSPNPDYPQPINVVTGLQTVTISDGTNTTMKNINLGKNLFDMGSSLNDYFRTVVNGTKLDYNGSMAFTTATFSDSSITFDAYTPGNVYPWTSKWVKLEKNTDYTISIETDGPQLRVCGFSSMDDGTTGADIANAYVNVSTKTSSFNSGNYDYYLVSIYPSAGGKTISNIQIEKGPTATDYAPYFTPIELCKIGDYQDYIYKDNGNWYLHKAVSTYVADGSDTWIFSSNGLAWYVAGWAATNGAVMPASNDDVAPVICRDFNAVARANLANVSSGFGISVGAALNFKHPDYLSSSSDFSGWITTNPQKVYYALATPTDTEITNAEVLAGLNQLGGGSLYAGTNNILVASENLPGTLQLTYDTAGGDDPGGFEWEAGGGGAISSITVDSISEVYPLITITGPATNPTLENITTSTTMSYSGTVAAGQTLIIDTMAQTAKLSGTNVVQNLYGDWLFLAPGVNRIAYTTTNSDAPEAEGEFNEIVG